MKAILLIRITDVLLINILFFFLLITMYLTNSVYPNHLEYGTGVPTEPVEQNMGVDIKYLQATNQELVKQINLLKSEITALQNDLNKERVTNKERELQLLKRENELERATQQLKDERSIYCFTPCDLQSFV